MMMKLVLLVVALALPMINTDDCTACEDIEAYIDATGHCEITALLDYNTPELLNANDPNYECIACAQTATLMSKVQLRETTGEVCDCADFVDRPDGPLNIVPCYKCPDSINHLLAVDSVCLNCDHVRDIADEVRDADDNLCCEELVKLLVEETEQDKLLGADDYGYNGPDESCVDCKELRKIAHNTRCNIYENTCYLPGKSPGGSSGYGSGGYDHPDDSYYNAASDSYNDYSWDPSFDGYYHKHALCKPETVWTYYQDSPDICAHIDNVATRCGYGKGTGSEQVTKCKYSTQQYDDLYKRYTTIEHGCDEYCNNRIVYDAAGASETTTESAGNTVETVGWVLIAVSGVLFLASIAFFMTGRSERKAAAENRMAGHGVMA